MRDALLHGITPAAHHRHARSPRLKHRGRDESGRARGFEWRCGRCGRYRI